MDVVSDVLDQPDEIDTPVSASAKEGSAAVQQPHDNHQPPQLCKAQCIAHFTSFAVHVMTGTYFKVQFTTTRFDFLMCRHYDVILVSY